jgi:hypothetical protein
MQTIKTTFAIIGCNVLLILFVYFLWLGIDRHNAMDAGYLISVILVFVIVAAPVICLTTKGKSLLYKNTLTFFASVSASLNILSCVYLWEYYFNPSMYVNPGILYWITAILLGVVLPVLFILSKKANHCVDNGQGKRCHF